MQSFKYLPLVYISLTASTCPLWVALLSFFILKEKLTNNYIVCLFISFIGIVIMVLGTFLNGKNEKPGQEV